MVHKIFREKISSDGKNTENVSAKKKQGFVTIKNITIMLNTMCLGPYMFRKAIGLWDSCSKAWYNVSEADLGQIEHVDKALWCRSRAFNIYHCEKKANLSTKHI